MNKKKIGFNLAWVLGIVIVTSIVSAITTGVIVHNNNRITAKMSYADLTKDEELNQFLEVYANIITDYYQDVDKKELLEKAIAAMMNYLGDDYTTYLDNENTSDLFSKLAGEYKGIGISINNQDKSIIKVYEDTPAYKAGILAGDIIIGINDIDVTNMSANEVVNKIKENKESFVLKLKRGEAIISITLKNETILSPNIEYKMIENTNIGYMYIDAFSNTLDIQMKTALKKLESNNMESLIIDLRDNTGGYLDVTSKVISIFTEKGKTIYSLNDKNKITSYNDETEEHKNYKIVVLTNGNTASASEIMTSALKESYGATIVGQTTFGKGKVQQAMKLENGSMVKYTSAYRLETVKTTVL